MYYFIKIPALQRTCTVLNLPASGYYVIVIAIDNDHL